MNLETWKRLAAGARKLLGADTPPIKLAEDQTATGAKPKSNIEAARVRAQEREAMRQAMLTSVTPESPEAAVPPEWGDTQPTQIEVPPTQLRWVDEAECAQADLAVPAEVHQPGRGEIANRSNQQLQAPTPPITSSTSTLEKQHLGGGAGGHPVLLTEGKPESEANEVPPVVSPAPSPSMFVKEQKPTEPQRDTPRHWPLQWLEEGKSLKCLGVTLQGPCYVGTPSAGQSALAKLTIDPTLPISPHGNWRESGTPSHEQPLAQRGYVDFTPQERWMAVAWTAGHLPKSRLRPLFVPWLFAAVQSRVAQIAQAQVRNAQEIAGAERALRVVMEHAQYLPGSKGVLFHAAPLLVALQCLRGDGLAIDETGTSPMHAALRVAAGVVQTARSWRRDGELHDHSVRRVMAAELAQMARNDPRIQDRQIELGRAAKHEAGAIASGWNACPPTTRDWVWSQAAVIQGIVADDIIRIEIDDSVDLEPIRSQIHQVFYRLLEGNLASPAPEPAVVQREVQEKPIEVKTDDGKLAKSLQKKFDQTTQTSEKALATELHVPPASEGERPDSISNEQIESLRNDFVPPLLSNIEEGEPTTGIDLASGLIERTPDLPHQTLQVPVLVTITSAKETGFSLQSPATIPEAPEPKVAPVASKMPTSAISALSIHGEFPVLSSARADMKPSITGHGIGLDQGISAAPETVIAKATLPAIVLDFGQLKRIRDADSQSVKLQAEVAQDHDVEIPKPPLVRTEMTPRSPQQYMGKATSEALSSVIAKAPKPAPLLDFGRLARIRGEDVQSTQLLAALFQDQDLEETIQTLTFDHLQVTQPAANLKLEGAHSNDLFGLDHHASAFLRLVLSGADGTALIAFAREQQIMLHGVIEIINGAVIDRVDHPLLFWDEVSMDIDNDVLYEILQLLESDDSLPTL